MLPSRLDRSLALVAEVMATARDDWWIIGSAAVALHGADAGEVRDIDVVLSVSDAMALLPALGIEPSGGGGDDAFRSAIYNRWTLPRVPAEFMAGFEYQCGGSWRLANFSTRVEIRPGLFVPARAELLQLLIDFGRPKDISRAASLRSA